MRIVFAGTPEFAAVALQRLIDDGERLVAVYTQPDRPAGRGRQAQPSAVKACALAAGLPVYQPESLKSPEAQATLAELRPDVMIVAAYGLILPAAVLVLPTHGCLNIHASLLPRWRGAAPIQRAIAAGDTQTGITIMQMDVGLDTGPMILTRTTPILPDDTGGSLHDRLAQAGADSIAQALARLKQEGSLPAVPQAETQATYAAKLHKSEGHIDWTLPAEVIARQIRAFSPWPGSHCDLAGQRLLIHAATAVALADVPLHSPAAIARDGAGRDGAGSILHKDRQGVWVLCGEGALQITQLQLPGSRAMSVADLINGGKPLLDPGQRLN